jgi:hypothetical protein
MWVSEVLGHSSVAITKDVYGHLVEGQKRAAAARMSEALLTPDGSHNGSQSPPAPGGCWLNTKKRALARGNTGAPGGIRTPNLLIRSQMLYPLSHGCGRLLRLKPQSNTVRVYRPRLLRPTENTLLRPEPAGQHATRCSG